MKIINSHTKYLTKEIIQEVFKYTKELGRPSYFDKLICGNGGSTRFLELEVPSNEVNILLAPNVGVVKGKEQTYNDNLKVWGDKDARFLYGGSEDNKTLHIGNPDIIVVTIDTFKKRFKEISKMNIGKVLIDEAHATIYQSAHRNVLKGFQDWINKYLSEAVVVYMTATPTPFTKNDIQIKYTDRSILGGFNISLTQDQEELKDLMIQKYKDGANVICFTQDANIMKSFKQGKKVLEANLILGQSMIGKGFRNQRIKHNPNSRLTIASSTGFEGWDCNYKDASIFFFESRSDDYLSFFPSNVYQAFNRTRGGAKEYHWCRLPLTNKRKSHFKNIREEVQAYVDDPRLAPYQKLSKKIPSDFRKPNGRQVPNKYRKYVYISVDKENNNKKELKVNHSAIDIYEEKLLADMNYPFSNYKKFYEDRDITINADESVRTKKSSYKTALDKIQENLMFNKESIKEMDCFGDDHIFWNKDRVINHTNKKSREINIKSLKEEYLYEAAVYLSEKNYDGEYPFLDRQLKVLELLDFDMKDSSIIAPEFDKIRFEMIKDFKAKQSEKLRKFKHKDKSFRADKKAKAIESIKVFEKHSVNLLSRLILMYINESIEAPSEWVVFRNYNILTQVGMTTLNKIAKVFDSKITEVDIVSCNIRILYGECGLELPLNIYGDDKKNKLKLNTLLNNFMYDEYDNRSKSEQRKAGIKSFRAMNIDEKVIDYLYKNYFENPYKRARGLVTNDLQYHEKEIISLGMEDIDEDMNEGCIRRHDSFLLWNNTQDLSFLNDFEYEGLPEMTGTFYIEEDIHKVFDKTEVELGEDVGIQTKIIFKNESKKSS